MAEAVLSAPEAAVSLDGFLKSDGSFRLTVAPISESPFFVSIALYFMGRSVPSPAYVGAHRVDPADPATWCVDLSAPRPGMYTLALAIRNEGYTSTAEFPQFDLNKPFVSLWMGKNLGDAPQDLAAAVADVVRQQADFRTRTLFQSGYEGPNRYSVHALLEGCLVDFAQTIEGGSIHPLKNGLGPESAIAAVNRVIAHWDVQFSINSSLDEDYKRSRPLAWVTFAQVGAASDAEAIDAISSRLLGLCGALAVERGSYPSPISYVIETIATGEWGIRFASKSYRGNLVSGFIAGSVTELLDDFSLATPSEPWIGFALGLLKEAIREEDQAHKLFKAWSLLEAAAKRRIAQSSTVVFDECGHPIPYRLSALTCNQDLGRVIIYLRDHAKRVYGGQMGVHIWTPSEKIMAAYKLRNMVAHEGGIQMPASLAATDRHLIFHQNGGAYSVVDWAKGVLRYECDQVNNKYLV